VEEAAEEVGRGTEIPVEAGVPGGDFVGQKGVEVGDNQADQINQFG